MMIRYIFKIIFIFLIYSPLFAETSVYLKFGRNNAIIDTRDSGITWGIGLSNNFYKQMKDDGTPTGNSLFYDIDVKYAKIKAKLPSSTETNYQDTSFNLIEFNSGFCTKTRPYLNLCTVIGLDLFRFYNSKNDLFLPGTKIGPRLIIYPFGDKYSILFDFLIQKLEYKLDGNWYRYKFNTLVAGVGASI